MSAPYAKMIFVIESFLKKLYPFLLCVWFAVFAVLLIRCALTASALSKLHESINETGRRMGSTSQALDQSYKAIGAGQVMQESLLKIINLVPEERGFLRTQKVVSDEVTALRRKVSRWIGKAKVHIVVDTKANKLYLKKGLELLMDADCSVGRGGILNDKATGRRWEFATPLGEFRIQNKIENPIWIKPDWAFAENGEPIPPPNDPARRAEGELGAFVLSLGDGYLIHGTKNERTLGSAVSHGCVRLAAENLDLLYQTAPIGTRVYIY
ncbi:MAG: hypothetical protein A2901_06825 [Elusimicrobia bacterium RIFCSPLOWO2_01_FULL_54_10]|nr:MAG: hypothetical protein A2901_06825 [Elusimicrobia bacterium RIFCSPLOWO2_01_FULL_54_10]